MRSYGRIETGFWRNQKTKKLSDEAKLLLLYLYACPHGNMIGCFVLPPEYISADMRWPSDRVSDRVSELVSNGFIDVCAETDLIRIRGWFGHNTIDNKNVASGAVKILSTLPLCDVFSSLIQSLNEFDNKYLNPAMTEYLNSSGYLVADPVIDMVTDTVQTEYETVLPTEFANTSQPPEPEPEPEPEEDSSDDKSSGGDPPEIGQDDSLGIPLALVALAKEDPRKALFDYALPWVAKVTGKRISQLRPLFGRWLKEVDDDGRWLYDKLADAQNDQVADPVGWITKTIQQRKLNGGEHQAKLAEDFDADDWDVRVENFIERGIWSDEWGPKPGQPGCKAPGHSPDR